MVVVLFAFLTSSATLDTALAPTFVALPILEAVASEVLLVPILLTTPVFFCSAFSASSFCFSRSFCFLSSVAVVAAVGLASLDGALRPPLAAAAASFLALSSACLALVSASLAAALSAMVDLAGLDGEASFEGVGDAAGFAFWISAVAKVSIFFSMAASFFSST